MGLREMIKQRPKLATASMVCVAVAAAVAIGMEVIGNDGKPPSKTYYSVDDGRTWFADSSSKLPPFPSKGGTAVRAYLFKGTNGKFVGLLEKYSDEIKARLEDKTNKQTGEVPVLVKKPGDKDWQPADGTAESIMLMKIMGADGSGIERVMP